MSPKARARLIVALVFVACAAPIVLGTLAWWLRWGTPAEANYGELLEPRTLAAEPFRALRGKWLLVTFDPASCPAECERKLYVVRQVHRAQGAGAERIERLWLVTDRARPRAELLAALGGAQVVPLPGRGTLQAFPGDAAKHIYLVDPLGNLILRYPGDPQPKKMIQDLERLLKLSQVG